jgi:hypothetical protein
VLLLLAGHPATGVRILAQDTRNLPRVRMIEWDCLFSALNFVLENPRAERGYEALRDCYRRSGMNEEADAVAFLLKERFIANDSDTHQK